MVTQASNESLQSVKNTFDLLDPAAAEVEYLDATKVKVSVAAHWNMHGDLVFTLEAERFDVTYLGVSDEKVVNAGGVLLVRGIN